MTVNQNKGKGDDALIVVLIAVMERFNVEGVLGSKELEVEEDYATPRHERMD